MSRVADIGAWWGLVAIAVVHIGAMLAGPVVNFLRDTLQNCRYWLLRLMHRKEMQELDKTYRSLKDTIVK